jgi:hypothetical protein
MDVVDARFLQPKSALGPHTARRGQAKRQQRSREPPRTKIRFHEVLLEYGVLGCEWSLDSLVISASRISNTRELESAMYPPTCKPSIA